MRLGSLCSGYGGLEAGLGQVLDIEPVWCSEIDKDASTVLATHHPDVPNLGDLTVLDWHQVEPVDIICAGFPCQPFSHAGKRLGADDERAIFEYIADGVSVLRPGLVVLENVPGILTLGGVSVIGTLTGLGYDCRWGIVRASDTGAPHRRARWFCLARNTDDSDIGAIARTRTRPSTEPAGTSRAAADASDFGHERARDSRRRRIGSTNGSGAAADASGQFRSRTISRPLWPESGNGSEGFGVYQPAIQRWSGQLGRQSPNPLDGDGRLSHHFVEWMMGLPEGWVCDVGLSRTAALKMLGNGVVPQQAALAVDLLL